MIHINLDVLKIKEGELEAAGVNLSDSNPLPVPEVTGKTEGDQVEDLVTRWLGRYADSDSVVS